MNASPLNLALLAPNVTAVPGGTQGVGGSVGGTRPRDNNFVVDGVDDNNLGVTGNNSTVIPDAVAEFNVVTNQFSAEYGHSAGGQFNLVTKSGTNAWHGSGEGYFQNRNFNANDNLTKTAIATGGLKGTPAFDNNRGGGTLGGPILKNKWFVFGAYEYTDFHALGSPTTSEFPTASGLATLKTLAKDPAVVNVLNFYPIAPANDAGTVPVGAANIPVGSLVLVSPNFTHEHDFQINSDYTAGKHQLGFRYLFNHQGTIQPVQTPIPAFNQNVKLDNRKIAVTDTWTINNRIVNDLRLSYATYFQGFLNPCSVCPPDVTIGDMAGQQNGPGDSQTQKQITYQIVDNVTYSVGKHTLKFGIEGRHYLYPQFFLPRSNGDYQYDTLATFINDGVPEQVGNTLRNAGTGSFNGLQSATFAFAQDDFKVTPRLTLNIGLRYEYWTNPAGSSTQTANAISNVPGLITFGNPKTDKNNFAPRIGFAYDPTGSGKWAVRGGFGVAYDVKFQNFSSITLPPQLQSELNEPSACTLTPTPAWCAAFLAGNGTTAGNFLAGGGLPQTLVPPTTQAGSRALTSSFIDDTVMPKILNWTLSVQHELYHNASIEVRYLGTRGLELPVQFRRNHISAFDAGIASLPTYFNVSQIPSTVNPATVNTLAPFSAFNSNTYAPFGFLGNITSDPPYGSSVYHAGSVNFVQRSRFGMTLNANYTYSHTIDDATNEFFTSAINPRRAQDTNNLGRDRSNSDLDVRNKFAFSWIYDVPKVPLSNGILKAILDGYQLNGTYVAQSGQPVTLQSVVSDSNGNGDKAGDRVILNPNGTNSLGGSTVSAVCMTPGTGVTFVGKCGGSANTIGYLADDPTARYVQAGKDTITTVGRNSFTSPGFNVVNFSVFKNTHLTERFNLQLRAEFFNVLNHRNFTLSNGNVFSNSGITVAQGNQAYINVTAGPQFFLNPKVFSGGNRQATLGIKLIF